LLVPDDGHWPRHFGEHGTASAAIVGLKHRFQLCQCALVPGVDIVDELGFARWHFLSELGSHLARFFRGSLQTRAQGVAHTDPSDRVHETLDQDVQRCEPLGRACKTSP
jgi:hypothetical protein